MAVRVTSGKVLADRRYEKGEIVSGLDKKEEARLISLGVAEYVNKEKMNDPGDKGKKDDKAAGKSGDDDKRSKEVQDSKKSGDKDNEPNDDVGEEISPEDFKVNLDEDEYVQAGKDKGKNKGKGRK